MTLTCVRVRGTCHFTRHEIHKYIYIQVACDSEGRGDGTVIDHACACYKEQEYARKKEKEGRSSDPSDYINVCVLPGTPSLH